MSSANKVLLLHFQYQWLLFTFFALFSWLETQAQFEIEIVRVDILALFPILGDKHPISHW
jgi:hypothetical protein